MSLMNAFQSKLPVTPNIFTCDRFKLAFFRCTVLLNVSTRARPVSPILSRFGD
jgi:hypothetical protein